MIVWTIVECLSDEVWEVMGSLMCVDLGGFCFVGGVRFVYKANATGRTLPYSCFLLPGYCLGACIGLLLMDLKVVGSGP